MSAMSIQGKGFEEMQARLMKSSSVIQGRITQAIRNSVTVITEAAKTTVSHGATGDLARSIHFEIDERNLIGVVGLRHPGSKYGIYVEKGSRPHWVPIKALERWSAQRGISPYAVQASIAKKGTKPHPFMIPAYVKNKKFVERQFSVALKSVTKDLLKK